jgi:peptide/nickel transport system ATP-binding protein
MSAAYGAAREASTPLLEVTGLARHFDLSLPWATRLLNGDRRRLLRAVDGIDFSIMRGETLSLVGESGCGKSTLARLIVGLHRPTAGTIRFDGRELAGSGKRPRDAQRRIQMIFQDPYASLNPRWRVRNIIAEPLGMRGASLDRRGRALRVAELLGQVGLAEADGARFPHEFSGGQRQRISIARALATRPDFLIADEPTSALDVSVQAQILNLMKQLQGETGLTYLFISHNLAVIYHVSDRVGVMYLGRLVELAGKRQLFRAPQHPYTRMLLDSIPDLGMSGRERVPVRGEVPSPLDPPPGCSFHPRCPLANDRCRRELPQLRSAPTGSLVACHAVEEKRIPTGISGTWAALAGGGTI